MKATELKALLAAQANAAGTVLTAGTIQHADRGYSYAVLTTRQAETLPEDDTFIPEEGERGLECAERVCFCSDITTRMQALVYMALHGSDEAFDGIFEDLCWESDLPFVPQKERQVTPRPQSRPLRLVKRR